MPQKPRRIALMLDLQRPYKRHAGIFAGTQRYAEEQDWQSIIDEFAADSLATRGSRSVPYDGIIARANLQLLKQTKRLRLPVVNVWASSPVQARLPSVFPEYSTVGQLSAEHLLARGFRNFATLTPPRSLAQKLVIRGFIRVVTEAGFTCAKEMILQDPWRDVACWRRTEQSLARCVAAWQPPIGIYVADEGVGRMTVQACLRRGLRVPQDVAIIAGQNELTLCEHPRPTLTSIEMGFERVGYESARLLHRLMEGETKPPAPIFIPPLGLVVRESTDFHAVEDALVASALRFIAANSHRPIGQDDVSRGVQAETRTLQNRFRKHLGRPIVAEIRRVRIERAKRELIQSRRSLAEIARGVGFGEAMRMYAVFRRELGITPSEFRRLGQVNAET